MKYCQHLHACLNKVKNSYYALLCYALYSALLCSALLLSSGLLSSPLLYSTLIYSSILHHTILSICNLREPWAECPRILQQLSYNLHKENNTASCQRTPRIHPENLKIPSQNTPKSSLKCTQNPPWEPPWNQTWKKLPYYAPKNVPREPSGPQNGSQNHWIWVPIFTTFFVIHRDPYFNDVVSQMVPKMVPKKWPFLRPLTLLKYSK